ncbi:nucleoside deaminase [Aquimarina sp. MMG016]|uniref:nucleoside deaminase n=1 Tax=Aquimarina sp. MMG016 TaxID=2822690 RepID=UPI001B3A3279|nr:nucleoside deaminase [Aquimarina sp. MMG016]MBQ4820531.1 nucleoside deaminase [Aquimarina sp. MMG016]
MQEKHIHFMQQAIALANKGEITHGAASFGAVVVKDDHVIAQSYNQVSKTQDPTQHAEILAIREACKVLKSKNLSDCILYTSCEPCLMCLGACHWASFKAIYFGVSAEDAKKHNFIYTQMFYSFDQEKRHREFNMTQLLRNEALAVW